MDIQRERTTHSPGPFTEHSPSNGGLPVVTPRDLPYDAYGKSRIQFNWILDLLLWSYYYIYFTKNLCRWHTNLCFLDHTRYTCRSLNQPRDCLQNVSLWMKNSKLKLNADKTEFLIIGTPTQRAKLDGFSRHIFWVRLSHQPPQRETSE